MVRLVVVRHVSPPERHPSNPNDRRAALHGRSGDGNPIRPSRRYPRRPIGDSRGSFLADSPSRVAPQRLDRCMSECAIPRTTCSSSRQARSICFAWATSLRSCIRTEPHTVGIFRACAGRPRGVVVARHHPGPVSLAVPAFGCFQVQDRHKEQTRRLIKVEYRWPVRRTLLHTTCRRGPSEEDASSSPRFLSHPPWVRCLRRRPDRRPCAADPKDPCACTTDPPNAGACASSSLLLDCCVARARVYCSASVASVNIPVRAYVHKSVV
jgi:hypothetical protein